MSLTISELLRASLERLPDFKNARGEPAHPTTDGSDWTPADWMVALTGEVGETANILKKVRRGDLTLEQARAELGRELADIQCYLVLLAHHCGVDLETATRAKFNEVSTRVGSSVVLPLPDEPSGTLSELRQLKKP
jgi:NTP pyrophosphatase (non-canonical NTP hydrolase)